MTAARRVAAMAAQTVRTSIRPRPVLDSRVVFHVYAWLAIATGGAVLGSGIRGIPGLPHERSSLIWTGGALLIAAGCAAFGLTLIDDPAGRRRAVFLFGFGHLLLGLVAWSQWALLWRDYGTPLLPVMIPVAAGVGLLAIGVGLQEASLRSETTASSSYGEHIRQIARREERARLARDLHDAVKQQLFVIQTAAATAQARFDQDAAGTRSAVEQVRTAAREATTELEALLEELQAVPLENTGLVEALRKQCEALGHRTGAQVTFDAPVLPPNDSLPPGAHEAIHRVAQEALANVARHARATRVTVALSTMAGRLELRVADNGSGFDVRGSKPGMGTANMRTRAAELGGDLGIESTAWGTEVRLSLPLRSRALQILWWQGGQLALLALFLGVFSWVRGEPLETLGLVVFALVAALFVGGIMAGLRRERRQGLR